LVNERRTVGALAALAQAGDAGAFAELVGEHVPRIRAFLFRLSRDANDLDDWTQETFMIATAQLGSLREPERFTEWLFGIAYRVCQGKRRRGGEAPVDADAVGSAEPSPLDAAARADEARWVWDAVSRLPERQRAALLLRQVEGMDADATAAILGVPSGTARRWHFEARERLREILTERLGIRDRER
jgi:RNA polymerase sigma-70 factor (ECF subfamily)